MEVEQIEVVKKWPELKSVQDIQVFLGFANFYWQFIQGFSKIAASLTSMLKTIWLPDVLRPKVKNSNSEVFECDVNSGSEEFTKISRKSKSQNLAKFQKLSKSGKSKGGKSKKLSKSGNSSNFGTTKTGSSFLTSGAKEAFNYLWLAFIEALILQYLYLEYHSQIETDVSGYAIGIVLS